MVLGVSGNAAVRAVPRPPGVLHPRLLHHTEGQAQQRVSKRIEPSSVTMISEHLCAIMFFFGLFMGPQTPYNVQFPL